MNKQAKQAKRAFFEKTTGSEIINAAHVEAAHAALYPAGCPNSCEACVARLNAIANRERIRKFYRVELHTLHIQARGDWSSYGADVYADKDDVDDAIRDLARSSCVDDGERLDGCPDPEDTDIEDLEAHLQDIHDHEITRGTTTAVIPAEYLVPCTADGKPITDIRDLPPEGGCNCSRGGNAATCECRAEGGVQ